MTARIGEADDIFALLLQVSELAAATVAFAEGAGTTLIGDDSGLLPATASASTDPLTAEIQYQQYDNCNQGPGVTAMHTGRAVISGTLGTDARWRRFRDQVRRLHVQSALALPLLAHDTVIGVIDLYAHERHAFTDNAVHRAEQLTGPAAVSLRSAQLLHAARIQATTEPRRTLTNRTLINQATGIIHSRLGASVEDAFERLQQISRTQQVALDVVAEQIVEDAVRRPPGRHQLQRP